MDHNKLSNYLLLIRQLIDFHKTLTEYQMKMETVEIILRVDLMDYPTLKWQELYHALKESLDKATCFIEDLILILNRMMASLVDQDKVAPIIR